jgi:AcrR family transcriptional regulator
MLSDMPKRTDSKERMILAARRLFQEHGYLGTALSDVVRESAAPRGSVYFHFPGGKEELATEVAIVHTAGMTADINRAAGATSTAADLIKAVISHSRDEFIASSYSEGCPVAPIVIDAACGSAQLSDASRRHFQDTITILAARLTEKGIPHARASELATSTITSIQGALILARVMQSPDPFDIAITELTASAHAAASTEA